MTKDAERIQEKIQKLDRENVTIVLFGQPGAGKSSLINAICGYEAAPVGVETDTTREPLFVEHGDVTLSTCRATVRRLFLAAFFGRVSALPV